MLVAFTVSNYRSIKEPVTFSLVAKEADEKNAFQHRDYRLLRSAVIYGANASGKSNLLKAMHFMKAMVTNQHKVMQTTDRLPHEPFRLNTDTEQASSQFEMVFFIGQTKYRYGFDADTTHVYAEWLYAAEKTKEAKLFYRDSDDKDYVNSTRFREGMQFFDKEQERIKLPDNQLFIWRCDQFNGEIAKSILAWFNNLNLLDGLRSEGYAGYALQKLSEPDFKLRMLRLLKSADIDIQDVKPEENALSHEELLKLPLPEPIKEWMLKEGGMKSMDVKTKHIKFDAENTPVGDVLFSLDDDESRGTGKFFHISAPILNTLEEGKILLIDELDASLHPILTAHLVSLFNNPVINLHQAQLIFVTHDTNLLRPELFRRDQVWLTEKSKFAATELFSLSQFKGIRSKEAFERQYLFGNYGGVPYISDFEL